MNCSICRCLLAVLFLCSAAFADSVVLKDGRRFEHCWIESYMPENGGTFHVRIAGEKSLSEQAYPLSTAMIQEINFSEIDEDGELTESRLGDITASNGQTYEDVEIMGGHVGPTGLALNVILPGQFEAIDAPVSSIQGAEFTKTSLQPTPYFSPEEAEFCWHVGTLSWAMSWEEEEKIWELPETELLSIRGYKAHAEFLEPIGEGPDLGISDTQFLGIVAGALLLILGITIGISIVMGTFLIKLVAWFEGLKDATWLKCLLCSTLLSTLPGIAFFLIFLFAPCMLKFLAIPAALFIARNVIMGCLEVMEGQAWTILILLIGMQWALGYLIGIVMGG